jgi:hypothetical protein
MYKWKFRENVSQFFSDPARIGSGKKKLSDFRGPAV